MIVDRQGVRPAESKLAEVAELTPPTTVEALRVFLGMTGYLRRYVEGYRILAAPLTNILRNSAFASKRRRRSLIPWTELHQLPFLSSQVCPNLIFHPSLPDVGQALCDVRRCECRGGR